jgi:hypothetical protein
MEENVDDRLAKLEYELASLHTYVAALAQGLVALEQDFVAYRRESRPVPDPILTRPPRKKADPIHLDSLPQLRAGWYAWIPFIERHGVSATRKPIMDLQKTDYCQDSPYQKPNRQGQGRILVRYALDPDGQARLLTTLCGMNFRSKLRQCNVAECPCHEIII